MDQDELWSKSSRQRRWERREKIRSIRRGLAGGDSLPAEHAPWHPERGEVIWGLPEASGGFGLSASVKEEQLLPRPFLLAETPPHKNAVTRTYPGTTKDHERRRRDFRIEISPGDVDPEHGCQEGTIFLLGTTRLWGTDAWLNRYTMRPAKSAGSTEQFNSVHLTPAGMSKLEAEEARLRKHLDLLCSKQNEGGE